MGDNTQPKVEVKPENVIASMNNGSNKTDTPMVLSNVGKKGVNTYSDLKQGDKHSD